MFLEILVLEKCGSLVSTSPRKEFVRACFNQSVDQDIPWDWFARLTSIAFFLEAVGQGSIKLRNTCVFCLKYVTPVSMMHNLQDVCSTVQSLVGL